MQNKNWESTYLAFAGFERNCRALKKANFSPEMVGQLQQNLLGEIQKLQTHFTAQLPEKAVRLALFSIVIYFDELVMTRYYKNLPINWPLLQRKVYNIHNGGEKFYQIVEELLKSNYAEAFVYEIFYFCLKHGFRGAFYDNQQRREAYLKQLEARVWQQQNQ